MPSESKVVRKSTLGIRINTKALFAAKNNSLPHRMRPQNKTKRPVQYHRHIIVINNIYLSPILKRNIRTPTSRDKNRHNKTKRFQSGNRWCAKYAIPYPVEIYEQYFFSCHHCFNTKTTRVISIRKLLD